MENGIVPRHWDLTLPPAEIHERYLVPAVYAQWAIRISHLAEIDAGCDVLDVGCGTGILARKAAEEAAPGGRVCGVDVDPEMLEIAARGSSQIEWREGDASDLPFEDNSFDRVLSQFMLAHVKNRIATVREMWRVLRPDGRLLLAVWAPLYSSPAFSGIVQAIREYAGDRAAELAALPWELGFESKLETIMDTAGVKGYSLNQLKGTARFPDVAEILDIWIRKGPAGPEISERQYRDIRAAARSGLDGQRVSDGDVVCTMNATLVLAVKR